MWKQYAKRICALLCLSGSIISPGFAQNEWKLVWSDEFDTQERLDTAVWNYEYGFKRNNEAQWYQTDNAYCKDGKLVIEARREKKKRKNPLYEKGSNDWRKKREFIEYTSSSITTAGKKEFLYGRFEVRAKIPTGGGAWPAIWLLGSGMDWPSCGEIDVMEYYRINGVPHILANACWGTDKPWDAKWNSKKISFTHFTDRDPQWADKYHIWRMDWDELAIKLYLDDELLNEIPLSQTINGKIGQESNPFHKPQYLLLNLAIGGINGGKIDGKNIPMKYEIDYIRVYQKAKQWTADEVTGLIHKANNYWQNTHPKHDRSFWDNAAYHTGNMEAFFLTGDSAFYDYSKAWAEYNEWKGAKSNNKAEWKSGYGESAEYVLFGDWQICFQTYVDLYNIQPEEQKIARAREVMEYQMSTDRNDYWWWADGLYMVMPVMTKMYKLTGNQLYLEKLHEYWQYANSIMYDEDAGLYFRDRKYVYPNHKSVNGKKDFWARGDGWIVAGLAKILKDLPKNDKYRQEYIDRFRTMAKAVAACQQPEGYWTRSMLDLEHAPGPETSGTAFFTYGLLWGINNGYLDKETYESVALRGWNYLVNIALQPDGRVGYVQPIGEKAIPGQVVDANSTANFGVGAFLLAACEMVRYLHGETGAYQGHSVTSKGAWCWFADPRALHYENKEGSINKTYIGYIDTHGNIKAMQYDFNAKKQEEVLVRSWFQPDDHNNPTFLVLPDERIMVFYSRHTDEACFYYRVSRTPGDITTLGEEKVIKTKNNTTYPSPFILSDDPEHIYLCWRGIKWHPTIAKLSLPDSKDNVKVKWGPYQLVQSTGARPYAKYASNGKDRIYLTYTTGHPDNEFPNFLYFNYVNIHTMQLEDIQGNKLSTIAKGPLKVNKTVDYLGKYPYTVVDNPSERDWVWQIASDKQGNPVIAMVRISADKSSHDYYYARWNGSEWKKTFLANAGKHFHQTPDLERCYSGGMAIDPLNTHEVYCSLPVEGKSGKVYEIVKYTLDEEGTVIATKAVTQNSQQNNVRPYIIQGADNSPLRLAWMHGDYYDWIVSSQRPQGYCTGINSDFEGFPGEEPAKLFQADRHLEFDPKKDFGITTTIQLDSADYQGCLLHLGELCYYLNGETMKPEVRYNGKTYTSTNVLGTADGWKEKPRGTNGLWYDSQKLDSFQLKLVYEKGTLCVYINGLLDQKINLL